MSDDLKPCPFCGGSIQLVGSGHVHWIYCAECESRGPECDRLDDARAAWNKRPGEEALQAEAIMLREARNAWMIHSEAARRRGRAEIAELGKEREALRAEVERLRGWVVNECIETGCENDAMPGPCSEDPGETCRNCCPMHRCGGGS